MTALCMLAADGHVAIMLGAAKLLAKKEKQTFRNGEICFSAERRNFRWCGKYD